MKQRVYIETTVVSYLTARPSGELLVAFRQAVTDLWWRKWRSRYEVYVSEVVLGEAARGDAEAARRRLSALEGIPVLSISDEAIALARMLVRARAIPAAEEDDATHVALAAVHDMDVLLTWNCAHIANVIAAPAIRDIIERTGRRAPIITTPEGLLEATGELP